MANIKLDQAELDRIESVRKSNDKFEDFYADKREEWEVKTKKIYAIVRGNFSSADGARIIESQGAALTYRQALQEEISFFLNKRSKETSSLKQLKHDKFIFYAIGFPLKTGAGEKSLLIDGNIRENQRTIELIDVHIDFLRNTDKNLESFQYSVKNVIQLLEFLGR